MHKMMRPYGCFQKLGYPKMDGLKWKTLLKMDDLGVPPFKETPISSMIQMITEIISHQCLYLAIPIILFREDTPELQDSPHLRV